MQVIALIVSGMALTVSVVTAWLTLFRRGEIRMTQPTIVFFGPDGPGGSPKVFLRMLLYSTAKRGQTLENMYVKLRRGESVQNFNVWVYRDNTLVRGSGLFVGESGVTYDRHFLLPRDGISYQFLPGEYSVETYATLVGARVPRLLNVLSLSVNDAQAEELMERAGGLYFDWGPDSGRYHSHFGSHLTLPLADMSA